MPVRSEILPVTRRKVMSPIPPAANGRKTRIGLPGYCACAVNVARSPPTARIAAAARGRQGKEKEVERIEFPPFSFFRRESFTMADVVTLPARSTRFVEQNRLYSQA